MTFKSTFIALCVIFIWASNFIAIKVGVGEIPPLVLLTLRFFFAGTLFLPFVQWPGWRKAITISIVGIIMGPLHQGFLYVSLTEVPASFMSILLQSNIIIVSLIGLLFFKESIGWRTWIGIFIGIIGIIILVGTPNTSIQPLGYFYGFAAAFFLALNYIGMKKIGTVNPVTYIVFLSLPSVPILFLSSIVIEGTDWMLQVKNLNWTLISIVLFYQAVIMSISHIIWQKLMVKYPLSQLVPLTLAVPLFAVIISVLFLDEKLTAPILIGGTLTISGVGLITIRQAQKLNK